MSYFAICFTNFVPDPEFRNEIGRYYIGTSSTMILVMILLMLAGYIKIGKLYLKRYRNKRTHMRKIAARKKVPNKEDESS